MRWEFIYITSGLLSATLSGVNGSSGIFRSKQPLHIALSGKGNKKNSISLTIHDFNIIFFYFVPRVVHFIQGAVINIWSPIKACMNRNTYGMQ